MSNQYECPFCDTGKVDLHIAGEYVETIDCPECSGSGRMDRSNYRKSMDAIEAFREAEAEVYYV